jgi:phage portal protein BeeE
MSISPEDAQWLEGRNFTAAELVTALFRIPPDLLGYAMQGTSAVTYQNLESRWTDLRRRCLGTWITKYEKFTTDLTPRPQYVKLNDSAFMRADEKTQYETLGIGIDKKFVLPNEAREKLDLEPLPGGDEFAAPVPPPAPAPIPPGSVQ